MDTICPDEISVFTVFLPYTNVSPRLCGFRSVALTPFPGCSISYLFLTLVDRKEADDGGAGGGGELWYWREKALIPTW